MSSLVLPCFTWYNAVQCVLRRELDMSKNITMQDLKDREITVFSTIPGMNELLQASPAQKAEVEAKYPDAVFAVVIASSLFNHNRELSEITQKAYFSILNGENIASVRFAYDKATDEYWKRHMWDD